jgi:predicted metal-dependent peptidase
MATQTAERRLKKTHINLMRTPEFAMYSGLLMVGETSISEDMPTACTDGKNKIYGRAFVDSLTDRELAFVVMHECLHVAFRHLTLWRSLFKINRQVANMACDYVINLLLVDTDPTGKLVAIPMRDGKPMALYDVKYRGMNSRQVFDDLMQKAKDKHKGNDGQPGEPGDGPGDGYSGIDEHDWEGAAEVTGEAADELAREVDQALRQGQIAHQKLVGKGSGKTSRELGDLLAPQVNWRDLLREFAVASCSAKDVSSWRRPSRRFIGQGVYMPSLIGETVRELVFLTDASGSTFVGTVFAAMMAEVKYVAEIIRPDKVHVIYWDTRVTGHEVYTSSELNNLVTSTMPKGGGGTAPSCAEAYLLKENIKPDCIINLTDGHVGGDWGKNWNAPILWVIAGNPNAQATTGKTIHIND